MDKFWEWMENKKYNEDGCISYEDCYYEPMNRENAPTNKMLIGYMTEYIFGTIKDDEDFDKRSPKKINPKFASVEQLYNDLKEIIEEM